VLVKEPISKGSCATIVIRGRVPLFIRSRRDAMDYEELRMKEVVKAARVPTFCMLFSKLRGICRLRSISGICAEGKEVPRLSITKTVPLWPDTTRFVK